MKKIVALVLALVMVLSLSSVAFAAPTVPAPDGTSLFHDYPGISKAIAEKVGGLVKDAAGKVAKAAGIGAWIIGGDYADKIWGETKDEVASITHLAEDILKNWNKPFYNVASILNFKYQLPFLTKKAQKDAGEAAADTIKKWIDIGIGTAGYAHDVAVDAGSRFIGRSVASASDLIGGAIKFLSGGIFGDGWNAYKSITDRYKDVASKTDATVKEYQGAVNENVAKYWANKISETFGDLLTTWGYEKNDKGLYVLVNETLNPEMPPETTLEFLQQYYTSLWWENQSGGKYENYTSAAQYAKDKAEADWATYTTNLNAWNTYQEFKALLDKQDGVEVKTEVLYNILKAPMDLFKGFNTEFAEDVKSQYDKSGSFVLGIGEGFNRFADSGVDQKIADVLGYMFRFGDKTYDVRK